MKHFLVILFLVVVGFTTKAQYSRTVPFFQEWYVGGNGGVNYYLAEGYAGYPIMNALGYIGRISIGYCFTPVIGIRGAVGLSTHTWPNKENNFQPVPLSAQHLLLNITANLSNLMSGYKKNRQLEFILLGGAGVVQRNKLPSSPAISSFLINGGLEAHYNLSSSLSLKILAEGNIVSDNFNNYIGLGAPIPYDVYTALSVGVSYRFVTPVRLLYRSTYWMHR